MQIPKKYGSYKVDLCPFCRKNATVKNPQQVPVCSSHGKSILRDLSCLCGDFLELRDGKYGPYFSCMNCGNISLRKAMERNPQIKISSSEAKENNQHEEADRPKAKKEVTITSDQVDVYYSAD